MSKFDEIYTKASGVIGKPENELKKMAEQVFATMLHHAMTKREEIIWTATRLDLYGSLDLEVNYLSRRMFVKKEKTDGNS